MMTLDYVTTVPAHLAEHLATGAAQARAQRGPVLVSLTERIPWQNAVAFFEQGRELAAERVFWEQPSAGWALAGVGAAQTFTATGPDRFARVDAAWRDLLAGARLTGADPAAGAGPVLLGGFGFDPARPATALWHGFPEALLVLPRFLLRSTATESWLTTSVLLWPDSDPAAEAGTLAHERTWLLSTEPGVPSAGYDAESIRIPPSALPTRDARPVEAWAATVAAAAADVRAGDLAKVVLAREVIVEGPQPFAAGPALRYLRGAYPNCYVFAVARGDRCFLGASPERLVRAAGGQVQVTCLAGSTARGATPDEDERLGTGLLASAKNRHEHAVVAAMLQEALAEQCLDVVMPAAPQLLKLANVQHLYTPVTARLAAGGRLLDLVARLHPTPAVGGTPRPAALAWIRAHEGLDRGWYAAPVGWLDAQGDGEFVVALRSGLIDGATAHLFAGCGIMGDSDPAAEVAESRLKLRPMLAALAASSEQRAASDQSGHSQLATRNSQQTT
jgi:isochorismate synthase